MAMRHEVESLILRGDIFYWRARISESQEVGLITLKLRPGAASPHSGGVSIMTDMTHVYEQHERRQDPNVHRHEEMRLGTIWESLVKSPSDQLRQADRLEPLKLEEQKVAASWRA